MKKYGFGVDIGGTTCKIGLFETTGSLVDKWEIPTDTREEGKNILPDIAASLQEKMAEKKIGKEEIEGIGIGLPGPVQPDGSVPLCVNLGWKNKNIPEEMGSLMEGVPVKAGNDANVAALGEMWQGGGKGNKSLVMVTLGTGVGGGIIIDEKIVAGAHGAGGEIGHITVNPHENISCNCGRKGCLEQGLPALPGRVWQRAMKHLFWTTSGKFLPKLCLTHTKSMINWRRKLWRNLPGCWEGP